MKENFFIEKLLPAFSGRKLTEEEMAAYRAPFPKESDRKLIAIFPAEIPFDGDPPEVQARVAGNYDKLQHASMPLLLLHATPGAIVQGKYLDHLRQDLPRMTEVDIGPGLHFIQESQPTNIGNAIDRWTVDLDKTAPPKTAPAPGPSAAPVPPPAPPPVAAASPAGAPAPAAAASAR